MDVVFVNRWIVSFQNRNDIHKN